jgi:hypothetical protein
MPDQISISKTLRIRDCGLNEHWLQDQVYNDPAVLQLGDLEVVKRERQQSSGGKLDLLLKNPEDDSMYEVEMMLGETDESHIIRTIEYWDLEKRRWPQRQHFAVLVAEAINRRFFNVIQLLSLSIPIIAIQSNIIEAEGKRILHFSKILDVYEEQEDEGNLANEVHDENYWRDKSAWTIENAKALLAIVAPVYESVELNYVKNYIALTVNNYNYFGFHRRSGNKSLLWFWVSDSFLPQVTEALDEKGIPYTKRKSLHLTVDKKIIETNAELFRQIATFVKQSWQN